MSRPNIQKVLVVARMTPRLDSRTRTLIRALSSTYQVDVISESFNKVTSGSYVVDGGHLDEIVLPLPGYRIWHLAGLLRVLTLNLKGIWRAGKGHYDIVVCSDGIYAWPGIVARLVFRRKFVYNAHEILWALGNPLVLSELLGWCERLSLQACNLWMVPSEARARIILNKHNLQKPYVVYENFPTQTSGFDNSALYRERLYQMGVPQCRPVIMFQGSLTNKRGLEQLVDVARSGQFHLVIQGSGVLLPSLREHQHANMTLLAPCPNEEAVSWLSAADLSFVYYENDCLNSAYACSSKFYVSVFAGRPVICNRLPAFELFAADYGGVVFFDYLESDVIGQCIADLLSDEAKFSALQQEMLVAREALSRLHREPIIHDAFVDLGVDNGA